MRMNTESISEVERVLVLHFFRIDAVKHVPFKNAIKLLHCRACGIWLHRVWSRLVLHRVWT